MLAVLARHRIVSGVVRRHHGAIAFKSDYHGEEKSALLEIVGAGGEESLEADNAPDEETKRGRYRGFGARLSSTEIIHRRFS